MRAQKRSQRALERKRALVPTFSLFSKYSFQPPFSLGKSLPENIHPSASLAFCYLIQFGAPFFLPPGSNKHPCPFTSPGHSEELHKAAEHKLDGEMVKGSRLPSPFTGRHHPRSHPVIPVLHSAPWQAATKKKRGKKTKPSST